MPKDTRSEAAEGDLGTPSTTQKTARKASTLSEMWGRTTSVSTSAKVSMIQAATISTGNENENDAKAAVSSKQEKRALSQATVVTQAILDSLEYDTMGESWLVVLESEFKKPYFVNLKKFLLTECTSVTVFPKIDDVYCWSRLTPFNEVKVIILGQDPYHDVGQAHGLSFSVLQPTPPPASLKNIYKQLEADIPGFKAPKSGDLSPIAKQGVLWLNTSLTVRAHKAGSHAKKGWESFTAHVIRTVLKREDNTGVVLMAWGQPAQKTFASVGVNESKHLLLKSAHPSPLSAHKGFLGNAHFRKANEWLAKKYGKQAEIDWTVISTK